MLDPATYFYYFRPFMRAFGFLSFGEYATRRDAGHPDARTSMGDAIEIAEAADAMGVNGAYFRVHHFARQGAAPMPLLGAIAARTSLIEVGTGVIDMRYENPLYLAEEAAALDLISRGRLALGISKGSLEPARRGWEAFGYGGSKDAQGSDIAREKFDLFMRAIRGESMVDADPTQFGRGARLLIEPHSPGLADRIWWGAGRRETAAQVGRMGVNLMSSTLLTEATGSSFADLQREQIDRYREAYAAAGHTRAPRVAVARSVFPITGEKDLVLADLGSQERDRIGTLGGYAATFGRTYVGEPDQLVAQLSADAAVQAADTLMLTIPSHLGPALNLRILQNMAEHVAPSLGWRPNTQGPVRPYPLP